MKKGDLVQFKPNRSKYSTHPKMLRGRTDEFDQFIPEGTRGIIIDEIWVQNEPGEPDPLDEFPYLMFTILTEDGVRTPGWTEIALDLISEGSTPGRASKK